MPLSSFHVRGCRIATMPAELLNAYVEFESRRRVFNTGTGVVGVNTATPPSYHAHYARCLSTVFLVIPVSVDLLFTRDRRSCQQIESCHRHC